MNFNNSIISILTYLDNGMWVFDDDRVGLVKEPFVAGADSLLDRVSDSCNSIVLVFSIIKFPGHSLTLRKVGGGPVEGTDYHCDEMDHDLWLCPALNLYYPESPDVLYVDVKPQYKSI